MDHSSNTLCVLCARERVGRCTLHPDEPLLDVRDPQVVSLLDALDLRLRDRTYSLWIAASILAVAIASALVCFVAIQFGAPAAIIIGFAWYGVVGVLVAGSAIGSRIAKKKFEPRFTRWTDSDFSTNQELEKLVDKIQRQRNRRWGLFQTRPDRSSRTDD